MASIDIILFSKTEKESSRSDDAKCNRVPLITLIYDIDGPLGVFGNIMSVRPNASMTYVHIALKTSVYVDINTGGELLIDDIQLIDGDYVWVSQQLNPTTNGIYIVRVSSWEFVSLVTDNTFIDFGAKSHDNIDGDISRSIVIDYSGIDFSKTGFYSIVYHSINSSGILTSKVRKIKVVPENASISPVPGYKISHYEINNETCAELMTATK